MLSRVKNKLINHYTNARGWRTDRKIVVFESDDWGAIRMSSKANLSKLDELGIKIKKCHYVQNDALASEEDMDRLFNLLSKFKDSRGGYPAITANVIMTNPDFEKIKLSNFRDYHFELFTDSLKRYPHHENSFLQWKEGMRMGLFYPQFHGREHVHVKRWMDFVKLANSDTRKAFDLDIFGLSTSVTTEKRKSYLASYDWDDLESRNFVIDSITEGLSLFESVFGYRSLSSIAPNYVWHKDVEQVMYENGVRFLQSSAVQISPELVKNGYNYIRHYTGQKNAFGQRYLVRNCKFEPSSNTEINWVDRCISDIKRAFSWNKPAIVEMHRVNFIGYIQPVNRDRNIKKFEILLNKIISNWPEIEFMTSDQLGRIIEENEKTN